MSSSSVQNRVFFHEFLSLQTSLVLEFYNTGRYTYVKPVTGTLHYIILFRPAALKETLWTHHCTYLCINIGTYSYNAVCFSNCSSHMPGRRHASAGLGVVIPAAGRPDNRVHNRSSFAGVRPVGFIRLSPYTRVHTRTIRTSCMCVQLVWQNNAHRK